MIDNLLVHRQVGCDDGRLPAIVTETQPLVAAAVEVFINGTVRS